MNQTPMNDIDWALLARYAAGECSPEERRHVERQLAEPSRYPEVLAAMDWVAAHAAVSVTPERRAALHHALRMRIVPEAPRPRVALAFKIAAAAVIAVGISFAGYIALRRPDRLIAHRQVEQGGRTIATSRGQRLSLRLSDGTLVVLAPASTLRIARDYGSHDRNLELVGQAAFTVMHDRQHPFRVRAGDLVAVDLGTEFVVRAYPNKAHAEVVVREGLVGLRAVATGRAPDVAVHAGELGRLSDAGQVVVQPADTAADFAWAEGRLVFRGTPLSEVIVQLERLYDIDIRVASPELVANAVSGTVVEARPATQALETIAAVLHLEAVQTGPRNFTLRMR